MEPAATEKYGYSKIPIKAKSSSYPSPLPSHLRFAGLALATLCASSFYLGPILLTLPPCLYCLGIYPRAAATIFVIALALKFHPVRPWPAARIWFELFYDVFDFHHNVLPGLEKRVAEENRLSMACMHPHGIIPIQAFLWSGFCNQVHPTFYGVGTTTDIALHLPILRQILGYLSVVSAQKKNILRYMQEEEENLFILPGGVAEIFLSVRNSRVQTIKARRYGLMKCALQTGAVIYPTFVFGANDLFDQLLPVKEGLTKKEDSNKSTSGQGKEKDRLSFWDFLSKCVEVTSRRMQGGLTLFWGKWYLPIPHNAKLTLVMADPIYPVPDIEPSDDGVKKTTCRKILNPTSEQVEELTERYVDSIHRLFEQYKEAAGYPNDTLQIT